MEHCLEFSGSGLDFAGIFIATCLPEASRVGFESTRDRRMVRPKRFLHPSHNTLYDRFRFSKAPLL